MPIHDWTQVRANRFHDFHQSWTIAIRNALNAGLLAVLAWSPPGRWLWHRVDGLGWAGSAAEWAAIVVVLAEIVLLPLAWWRGLEHERRWGFSTQSTRDWAAEL